MEHVASIITLMSACAQFFKYEGLTMCGIPGIRLEGTVEDWERVRTKASQLLALVKVGEALVGWPESLDAVLSEFVRAKREGFPGWRLTASGRRTLCPSLGFVRGGTRRPSRRTSCREEEEDDEPKWPVPALAADAAKRLSKRREEALAAGEAAQSEA